MFRHSRPSDTLITGLATCGALILLLLGSERYAHAQNPEPDVLSIGGSVTEIVVALGQQHRLKARDATSTYPPDVTDLPDVGYMRSLSPEGVLSAGPSLIIAEEGAGPREALNVIREAKVGFVEVPDALTARGILRKIEIIGDALDVPDRAARLSAQVETALADALADAARPTSRKKRVLFVLSTQGGKINASGTGTAADSLIRMAGGVNAVTEYEGYKQITDEAVGLAAPDVILMMDRGGDHGVADDELFAMPAIRLTPAAQTRAVVRMDGLLMLGFGPRTAQAIRTLNDALYGQGA
ncbi:ABC transporter substrate-binding protein [Lutimaribacter sp. EGI FJ00015]|uniref:ABC transporter substrate-binding protein n=1 Tax=Lutimaribacter degradans TaxID=2945989 RepID=A0ACC5ZUQ3_9RHOB|nr:ABC transporter substrate-binding protein [Lutimaribacter sp. EGI FJ00013]MCM2562016.1 ABC transporter substrate-binding protein [Lutimaribacter sp. EGI FJ00013]MCO0612952.1 ABC transporter substrate-binding protein [Lutimaribacter sp. EGI FJ00015]MCO0635848.1 ABC transporter substrate-binding protein [Lutimaribacter sp. EGI FJ00014]